MGELLHNLAEHYRTWADKRTYEKVVNNIVSTATQYCKLKKLTQSQIGSVQDYWQPLVGKRVDTRLHQLMLSLTGVFKPEFEPFEICREVQDRSMRKGAMNYFDDKNLYRLLLADFNIPVRVAECCNGVYYLPEMGGAEISFKELVERVSNETDCLIKPSVGTSGGQGICPFDTNGGIEYHSQMPIADFLKKYGRNFCIERKVVECDNLQRLNPSSCNTLRVHTMRDRKNQCVRFLSSYIRIGKMGEVVDNMHSGGVGARIWDDGCLRNAVSCYPYKSYDTTECGVKLDGYKIDGFDKIVQTCIEAHSRLPMFDLMGWDVAVDKDEQVIIIEYNPNPDIRVEQAIIGDTCLLDNQEWVMKQYYGK